MPPKQASSSGAGRGRAPKNTAKSTGSSAAAKGKQRAARPANSSPDPETNENEDDGRPMEEEEEVEVEEEDDEESRGKSIPPELLTRILHEFFEHTGEDSDGGGTRITRDANAAVAKYMDVFVKEAIARAAAEREGGFLEVEDLEKIAPQLLLDL